jgi:uncharacterized protein (DUF433 family)
LKEVKRGDNGIANTAKLGVRRLRSELRNVLNGREAMKWQDRIVIDKKVLVGKPVIKGTRMAVEFVIDLLARGWTTEQILHEYDHLTAEDIQACLRENVRENGDRSNTVRHEIC